MPLCVCVYVCLDMCVCVSEYFVLMALLCFRDICERIVCFASPSPDEDDHGGRGYAAKGGGVQKLNKFINNCVLYVNVYVKQ